MSSTALVEQRQIKNEDLSVALSIGSPNSIKLHVCIPKPAGQGAHESSECLKAVVEVAVAQCKRAGMRLTLSLDRFLDTSIVEETLALFSDSIEIQCGNRAHENLLRRLQIRSGSHAQDANALQETNNSVPPIINSHEFLKKLATELSTVKVGRSNALAGEETPDLSVFEAAAAMDDLRQKHIREDFRADVNNAVALSYDKGIVTFKLTALSEDESKLIEAIGDHIIKHLGKLTSKTHTLVIDVKNLESINALLLAQIQTVGIAAQHLDIRNAVLLRNVTERDLSVFKRLLRKPAFGIEPSDSRRNNAA